MGSKFLYKEDHSGLNSSSQDAIIPFQFSSNHKRNARNNNPQLRRRNANATTNHSTPNSIPNTTTKAVTATPFHEAPILPAALFLLSPNGNPWVLNVTFWGIVVL